jgi:RNA polymerase sigma-70 factor, ECF subfamily
MSAQTVSEFEQIVSEYERNLRGFARRIVGNTEDAEEVVQDAFVRAHRALNAMSAIDRAQLRLRAWLYTVTLNVARNKLRKKRPLFVSLDAMEDPSPFLIRESTDASPESALEERLNLEIIEGAILEVPEHLQATARLRFIDGLTNVEIARRFGQPVGTVKSHVHRAAVVMRRIVGAQVHAA